MTEKSVRLALPFILPGQAQKEAFHNEALAILDAALHAAVEDGPINDPPPAPAPGQSWLVGTEPFGEFAGQAGSLACWSEAGWRFVVPVPGMLVWDKTGGFWLHWTGSAWSGGDFPVARLSIGGQQVVGPRLPDVPSPSGGTVIDAEARAAVGMLIATLKSHGLID